MQRTQQIRKALGSEACLTLVLEDRIQPEPLFAALWQRLAAFEQTFSRFLPDSELNRLNRAAGARHPVSPAMHRLLKASKTLSRRTKGLYNPFVLPALQRAGYKGSWPKPAVAQSELIYESRGIAPWNKLVVGDTWATIPTNTALDFGGIGKGYVLDQLAAWLQTQHVTDYWLSLGGDIICAGQDVTGGSWRIAIQDAKDGTHSAATVENNGQVLAIATSGVTKRRGMAASGPWHHLIDPRTGLPATTEVLTATVCARSATEADVLAKCLVITSDTTLANNALLQFADNSVKVGDVWT